MTHLTHLTGRRTRLTSDIQSHATISTSLVRRVKAFVHQKILPREAHLAAQSPQAEQLRQSLTADAVAQGLYGTFFPSEHGGKLENLSDYLPVAQQEGRSEYGPGIFGADLALDCHLLARHATPTVKNRYLSLMAQGLAVSSYAMSEPERPGSIPDTIQCRAVLRDGTWRVTGRKWFVCRSHIADFVTVLLRTDEGVPEKSLSMMVVPTDSPGFEKIRPLCVLGRFKGQSEIEFRDVAVPDDYVLGKPGQGLALMQQRLNLGRLLRSAHWSGLATRCFDLMHKHIGSPKGQLGRLADKQLVRARIYKTYREIIAAQAMLRETARHVDAGLCTQIEINTVKLACSDALSVAADNAVQIIGAQALSDDIPLSDIYRIARASHIMDGADDALISAIGHSLIKRTDDIW